MNNKNYRLYSAMYILLIASLPLFSIRFSFLYGGSLSLYVLIAISIISLSSIIVTGRVKKILSRFDFFLISLILISIVSILIKDTSANYQAIYKTLIYFSVYLSLKYILAEFTIEKIESMTLKGVYLGLGIFSVIILYAIQQAGGIISLLSTFDYFNFTYRIFEQISLLTNNRDFSSKDIMRNALGEVFAFYFVFLLIAKINKKKYIQDWGSILLSIVFVIITFSRRAFITSVASLFIITSKGFKKNILASAFLFLSFSLVIYLFIFNLSDDSRLATVSISGRATQFELVLESLSDSVLTGKGYGEKLLIPSLGEKVYIHNFIISNFYMLGILGLILSFLIFMQIFIRYVKAIPRSIPHYDLLLSIPLAGMLVGGTTEGMFTVTSWIILAITEFRTRKQEL